MIRLNFIEVIVFYEVPQIFIATDIFDCYIRMMMNYVTSILLLGLARNV